MIPITNPNQFPKDAALKPVTEEQAKQAALDGATVYALTHRTLNYTEYFVASSVRNDELSLDK